MLGNVDALFAEASFFGAYAARHAVNPDNLGQRVRSSQAQRRLWFEQYRSYLLSAGPFSVPSLRPEVEERLRTGGAGLERYWRARRADYVLRRIESVFAQKYPVKAGGNRAGVRASEIGAK